MIRKVVMYNNQNNMKYFIYCRRSSEEESRQVQSLETQERELLEYASKHNLHIVEIIKESKSAKTDGNRPLFTKMLERISNGEASGLLVLHIDRLSRNGIESGTIIKLFESARLEEIRTPSRIYASAQDMLYMDFDFVFAAHYSRNLSIRIREGNKTKLSKGEYIGCPPLGYIYEKGKLYPDPLSAKYVKKAFSLYSTGQYSLKQITNMLYLDGFRSRLVKGKVPKASIHTLLLNPVYYGVIRRAGMLYKGIHKPLVSKSVFDKVQDILQGKNRSKHLTHYFLYRNYLSCAVCTCKLTATKKKEKYNYYYCTNGKNKCDEHKKYLNEPVVAKLAQGAFKGITIDKELADLAFDIYKDQFLQKQKEGISQKDLLQKQISDIDKKLDKLLSLYLSGNLAEDIFLNKQKALQNEKATLQVAVTQVKSVKPEKTLELLEKFKNEACELEKMFEKGNEKVRKYLLHSALWNLHIQKREVASIQYKLPYAYLEKAVKKPNLETMLSSLDSNQNKQIQSLLSYR